MRRLLGLTVGMALLASACAGGTAGSAPSTEPATLGGVAPGRPGGELTDSDGNPIPPAPDVPEGDLPPEVAAALEDLAFSMRIGVDLGAIRRLGEASDPRLGWVMADLLRFFPRGDVATAALTGFNQMMDMNLVDSPFAPRWSQVTNLLIAWDVAAPPGYVDFKRDLYTLVEPGWGPFFEDEGAQIDWRLLSWGGVRIDDRPLGDPEPCPRGCIPALDDPAVTDAASGEWYPEDAVVFGVILNGEARAYPKNIMEVHEMVNDTLGGRRIGLPYCTLCGSAQAYLTDSVPDGVETPVLRTSGLLSRSNKVTYDLITKSVFDTFRGTAVAGPLRERGVTLEQVTVVATTWGEWRREHPDTTIVAEDGGIGREYPADPLRGRDDGGPIFPVGDVDPRLPVQEPVIGVVSPSGLPVAFPAAAARQALEDGFAIEVEAVSLTLDGGGIRAVDSQGRELATHQAFWFAWSQFHPDTLLWEA